MLPFLLASALTLVPEPAPARAVNLIAPYPAAALKSTKAFPNKMTTFYSGRRAAGHSQACCDINLGPQQSLMAEVRAENAGHFEVVYKDQTGRGITGAMITRVGGKLFLINRNHTPFPHVVCVVLADTGMDQEPYELVLAEIDADLALAGEKPAKP